MGALIFFFCVCVFFFFLLGLSSGCIVHESRCFVFSFLPVILLLSYGLVELPRAIWQRGEELNNRFGKIAKKNLQKKGITILSGKNLFFVFSFLVDLDFA